MRVAYICPYSWEHFYPECRTDFDETIWCTSNNSALRFPRAVQELGVQPVLFYLSATAGGPAEFTHRFGFPLRRVPVRFRAGHLGAEVSLALLRALHADTFDLFHYYNYYGTRWWPDMFDLFAWSCRRSSMPFVAHYQGGSFPGSHVTAPWKRFAYCPKQWLKRWALLQAERLIVISRSERQKLSEGNAPGSYGTCIPPSRIIPVSNIVDTTTFAPIVREDALQHLNLDPAHRYILYVGFLREGKGLQHMLNIMPTVVAADPRMRLLVVGDGEYKGTLRRQAERLSLTDNVLFVGHVENDQLAPYYSAADVHVLPSYREGMPSVVLEALACGTPTVATSVGGIPEVLAGELGLLVPPRDEDALRAAVLKVLRGEFTPDAGERKTRLHEHSYEHVGRMLHDTYTDILGKERMT